MEFFQEESCSYCEPIEHDVDYRNLEKFSFNELPIELYPYAVTWASGLKELSSLDPKNLVKFLKYFDSWHQLPRELEREFVHLVSSCSRQNCKVFLVDKTFIEIENCGGFFSGDAIFISMQSCDNASAILRVLRHEYLHFLQHKYRGAGGAILGIDVYDFAINDVLKGNYREYYKSHEGIGEDELLAKHLRSEMEAVTVQCNAYMWADIELELINDTLADSKFYPSKNREQTITASFARNCSVFDDEPPMFFTSFSIESIKEEIYAVEIENVRQNIKIAENNRRSKNRDDWAALPKLFKDEGCLWLLIIATFLFGIISSPNIPGMFFFWALSFVFYCCYIYEYPYI